LAAAVVGLSIFIRGNLMVSCQCQNVQRIRGHCVLTSVALAQVGAAAVAVGRQWRPYGSAVASSENAQRRSNGALPSDLAMASASLAMIIFDVASLAREDSSALSSSSLSSSSELSYPWLRSL